MGKGLDLRTTKYLTTAHYWAKKDQLDCPIGHCKSLIFRFITFIKPLILLLVKGVFGAYKSLSISIYFVSYKFIYKFMWLLFKTFTRITTTYSRYCPQSELAYASSQPVGTIRFSNLSNESLIFGGISGQHTIVSILQSLNALSPILLTLFPIVTLVRLLQPQNALVLIVVTLSGIVTLFRLLQSQNAPYPIVVTLSGIVTLVRLMQEENALSPIVVTLSPIVTLVRLLHL